MHTLTADPKVLSWRSWSSAWPYQAMVAHFMIVPLEIIQESVNDYISAGRAAALGVKPV